MNFSQSTITEITHDLFFVLLGAFIFAIGTNLFLVPTHLLSGGVNGIALILQYIFKIPAGLTIIALNIPLFVLSYKNINKRFTLYSLIGTLAVALFVTLTSPWSTALKVEDPLLFSIYGGVVNGLGIGIILSNHGSTGGIDIISIIIKKKYPNFEVGKISFAMNLIIVAIGAVAFDITRALYTLVSMYITAMVLDKVLNGFYQRKLMLVVTDKPKEVGSEIMLQLKRGVTFIQGTGAYTGNDKKIIYCVIESAQLPRFKEIVKKIDPKSFTSILNTTDVDGKGFKNRLV